ncbi:MAG: hypothetical protein K2W82_16470 [Candidatus Obscuribacterales bacterium]|nr:hypothetical protein [Candidatus Obscuribacterales bacterium]
MSTSNRFRGLFEVRASECGAMVDNELKAAGIQLVSISDGSDRYNMGVLQFGAKQALVAQRHPDLYVITLAETPSTELGRRLIEIDGVDETGFERFHRHGTAEEGSEESVRCWCISLQSGLNAFIAAMRAVYGEPDTIADPNDPTFAKMRVLLQELEYGEAQAVTA